MEQAGFEKQGLREGDYSAQFAINQQILNV